jgi:hypothetical protein
VLKHINSVYDASSARRRYGWIKVKKNIEIDAYVSGFERGKIGGGYERKVGALVFSVMTEEGSLPIAKVANLPWDFRKEITEYDKTHNQLELSPNVYGQVAHLIGLELSRQARRLVHPRIVYWRNDLAQDKCIYSFKDIDSVRKGATDISLSRVVSGMERGETTRN